MNALEKRTLPEMLRRSVSTFPDRPALSWVDGPAITYAGLGRGVRALSQRLAGKGVSAGDRVALLSENRPQWGVAHFAVTSLGAVVVPILPDFNDGEILEILRHSGAGTIIVSERHRPRIAPAETGSGLKVIVLEEAVPLAPAGSGPGDDGLPVSGRPDARKADPASAGNTGSAAPDGNPDPGAADPENGPFGRGVREEDTAAIIYTSGTTGHSKGVVLTHRNFMFDALATLKIQDMNENDRLLSVLPLSHCYEFTIGFLLPVMKGACVYYLDKPPVARVLMPALAAVRPTMMLTVPLIMEKLYKTSVAPKLSRTAAARALARVPGVRRAFHWLAGRKVYRLFGGRLRFFGIGGSLLSAETERFLREARFPYAVGYGLTETSPLVAGCTPAITRFRSTGPVLPGVECRLNDPDPRTGQGEIWVRGENVMTGYYADPERTAAVLTPDGWFRTGDLGVLDRDGYLYIKGRLKNTILGPSGENIYPEEIESILNKSEEVLESLVTEEKGQLVARVHLNREEIHKALEAHGLTVPQIEHAVQERLEALRHKVNASVSRFSRIKKIVEHPVPFEKTATQKIKRYLYAHKEEGKKEGK